MVKRLLTATLAVILTLSLAACGPNDQDKNTFSVENGEQIGMPQDISIDGYSILLEDSYIFYSFTKDDEITYFRQFFDGRCVEIGSVPDFEFSLGFHSQIGNGLYFYLTTAESAEAVFENNAFENNLYCIDLVSNALSVIRTESKCLPGAIIASLGDSIVSRQSERSPENHLSTYIELLDTQTGMVKKTSPIFVLDDNTNIGSYMMNMCVDGDYIYALIDERHEDGSNSAYLYKYNEDFDVIQKIGLDAIAEYILSARVGEMSVCGDCLYLKNYSRDAVVAVIEEDEVRLLLQENGIQKAKQYESGSELVFFTHGGNTLYFYNPIKHELTKQELVLDNDYLLKNIMEKDGTMLIATFAYASSPTDTPEDILLLIRN